MANSFRSPIPKKVYNRKKPCSRCNKIFISSTRHTKLCPICLEKSKNPHLTRKNPKSIRIETQYKDVLERLKKEIFPDG